MNRLIITFALILFVLGCATAPIESVRTNTDVKETTTAMHAGSSEVLSDNKVTEQDADHSASLVKESLSKEIPVNSYKESAALFTSLLKSSQSSLSEKDVTKILSSRVVLPKKGHLAIMIFPGPEHTAAYNYGDNYKSSEAYLKTQRSYIDRLTRKLEKSDRIVAVTLLPDLLAPNDAGIPVLREAAVRLQADLLLAFRINSDLYNQSDINRSKAFSTIEAVLMDIRTGLIPYTTVVTRDNEQKLSLDDTDMKDVRIRAEVEAVLSSLSVVASEITDFLSSVPK